MEVTLKSLLQFLPLDDNVRQQVLGKVDSFTSDQTLEMNKLCWRMFYFLLQTQTQFEFDKLLLEAGQGQPKLKKNLYKEIEDKLYKKFIADLRQGQETTALEEVRQKIQQTVQSQIGITPNAN